MEEKTINSLKTFVSYYRNKCLICKNIQKELEWINNILNDIYINLEYLNSKEIKSDSILLEKYEEIFQITNIIVDIKKNIGIRKISYLGSYIIGIKISKIRLKIIHIIKNIGCCKVSNIIKLYINEDLYLNYKDKSCDTLNILNILDTFFKPISCNIYKSKEYEITQNSEYDSIFRFIKLISFGNHFLLKLNGCKIYIPFKDKQIIVSGFFNCPDNVPFDYYSFICKKRQNIETLLEKTRISLLFKKNFSKQINIRNLLLFSVDENIKQCKNYYNDYLKYRNKNISNLIKEFVNGDLELQRYIIFLFLLNARENQNIYIIYILFDIINNNKKTPNITPISKAIYESLNHYLKQYLKEAKIKSDIMTDEILNISEDIIPYEKRILLMKSSSYIKNKAMEKLKEINNSKGGENNAKAIQYIEGLLKIPFGIYKKESITLKLDNCKNRISF